MTGSSMYALHPLPLHAWTSTHTTHLHDRLQQAGSALPGRAASAHGVPECTTCSNLRGTFRKTQEQRLIRMFVKVQGTHQAWSCFLNHTVSSSTEPPVSPGWFTVAEGTASLVYEHEQCIQFRSKDVQCTSLKNSTRQADSCPILLPSRLSTYHSNPLPGFRSLTWKAKAEESTSW